ncbi:hypothetical protein [Roseateles sp. P5_E7]
MNREPFSALRRLALLGGLAALLAPSAQASQLVPQNLKQMIQASDLIVTGEVTKLTDGIENGLPFTEVTLKVKESVKRDLALNSSYKFRQYGLLKTRRMGDGRYMLPAKIEGMASWKVGEKVTTFMNKPALRTGMVTPVGLAQGKFTSNGARLANSFNNRDLFKGMTVDPSVLNANEAAMLANKSGGAVEGGVLNRFVKRAISEQWIEKGVMR